MSVHPDSPLIDDLGGPTAVAALCQVSPQAVSQWRRDGIPKARRMYLAVIRPDLVVQRVSEPAMETCPRA